MVVVVVVVVVVVAAAAAVVVVPELTIPYHGYKAIWGHAGFLATAVGRSNWQWNCLRAGVKGEKVVSQAGPLLSPWNQQLKPN